MWVIVLFDLPTDDVEMKRDYRYFRKFLLNGGFTMMQYSVYMRHSSLTSLVILIFAFFWYS
jgi:CRISPR-associated protein Cas2